jgi:hypothetical protein
MVRSSPSARSASKNPIMRIIGIAVVVLLAIGAIGWFTVVFPHHQKQAQTQQAACINQVKDLTRLALLFAQDHNGRLPSSRWSAELVPYLDERGGWCYHCPTEPSGFVDYAMNKAVVSQNASSVSNHVLFFETTHPGATPVGGNEDFLSPPRHPGGSVYSFVNGKVECSTTAPQF